MKKMNNYESFLICDHENVTSFYIRGIPVCHWDKVSQTLKIEDGKEEKAQTMLKTLIAMGRLLGENIPSPDR